MCGAGAWCGDLHLFTGTIYTWQYHLIKWLETDVYNIFPKSRLLQHVPAVRFVTWKKTTEQ
jgi:hypothetical protein